MYINEKVRLISSTLSSLALLELTFLRAIIDSIITKKEDNVRVSILFSGDEVQVISSGISQNKTTIPQTSFTTESTVVNNPVISYTISEVKQLTPTQNSPRPLGIWKGKVEISEDFHKTSSDIISEFGIE
ncbi:hypothetical protein A4S05_16635 [Nostoc sp. KVJ20]|uniref:hypothetical protein n=1 Tax=unclassified Nostoc TaxID=2593658 RepID=UPI00083CFD3F|nr:hypothetical protein [Nostoc sp. KVJ20]ODG96867.1 hypothetical protein A4S05_16635 [Nostoc sp. KVJ20]